MRADVVNSSFVLLFGIGAGCQLSASNPARTQSENSLWATVRRPRKTVLRNPQFFMLAQGFHQSISWRHTISHRDFLDCEPHNRD